MNEARFAGVCITQDSKILLVQEAHTEAYGLWSLPLGHMEGCEDERKTALRETKEETGYDVVLKKGKELDIDGKEFKSTSDFNDKLIKLTIFEGEIINGDLKAGNDILDAKWFTLDEIEKLPLRGSWLKFFLPS